MSDPQEIENYLNRLSEHYRRQLTALEHAVESRYQEKPYWDPVEQGYRFVTGAGRERKFAHHEPRLVNRKSEGDQRHRRRTGV